MSDLRPCPLCGDPGPVLDICDGEFAGEWFIRCEYCGTELGTFPVKETCVKRWNERNDSPDATPDDRQHLADLLARAQRLLSVCEFSHPSDLADLELINAERAP